MSENTRVAMQGWVGCGCLWWINSGIKLNINRSGRSMMALVVKSRTNERYPELTPRLINDEAICGNENGKIKVVHTNYPDSYIYTRESTFFGHTPTHHTTTSIYNWACAIPIYLQRERELRNWLVGLVDLHMRKWKSDWVWTMTVCRGGK